MRALCNIWLKPAATAGICAANFNRTCGRSILTLTVRHHRSWSKAGTPLSERKHDTLHGDVFKNTHKLSKRKLFYPNNPWLLQFHRNYSAKENELLQYLKKRITMAGPLTVADYMKEVLTNPLSGYYMHRDVFGSAGDFITSPEISQMFGEMLGVWIVNEWLNCYTGQELQLVELGPGRGTLADDMLRVFSQFPEIGSKISLHLVEISPALSNMQAIKLVGEPDSDEDDSSKSTKKSDTVESDGDGPYRQETSKYGPSVSWYKDLSQVPEGLSCFIGHEFLDALPIHKFHKTEKGWREVMVDVDPEKDGLRFVLAPTDTPASKAFLQVSPNEERNNLEVCPSAGIIIQEVTKRILQHGGFSLFADYGHSGEKGGTFRAFKQHKLHDPLEDPGSADLTADVDFDYLQRFSSNEVSVYGPITQEKFLTNMGIGYRLQSLLASASQDQWASLISGYKMLTSPEQMGERFKFFSITRKHSNDYAPAGFSDLHVKEDTPEDS